MNKKVEIYFDKTDFISFRLNEKEVEELLNWLGYDERPFYQLLASTKTYVIAKNHIRHIIVKD